MNGKANASGNEVTKSNQQLLDSKQDKNKQNDNKCITCLASRPKWFWFLILGVIICAVAGGVTATLVALLYNPITAVTTDYPMNSTIGKPCKASADCISNSYCSISASQSTGTCICITTYYFDASTSTCLARKSQSVACTYSYECLEHKRLSCISGACSCDTNTEFWNSTVLECQYLKTPFTLCTAASECLFPLYSACTNPAPLNSISNTYRCICNPSNTYWYNTNTGLCENKKLAGVQCSYDYECTANAYCTYPSGSTNKVCVCDTLYFNNNGQCSLKPTTLNSGCSGTVADQCNLNQNNLRCFSGLCRCDSTAEVWDNFYSKCVLLKPYGQTCTANSECVSGLTCQVPVAGGTRKACICTSSQYFDWITGTCLTTKAWNSICDSRFECSNQDTMVCVTSGGVTKRCLCAPNYAYQSGTTCLAKKTVSVGCSSNSECQEHLGFYCSGTCICIAGRYYDSVSRKCIAQKRRGDACTSSTECTSGCCNCSFSWLCN